jgi:hypothetical protein
MRIINLTASLGAYLALISFGTKISALFAEASDNQPSFAKACLQNAKAARVS